MKHYSSVNLRRRRRITNAVMLSLSGLATLLVIAPLLWVLGFAAREGISGLSLDFFTKLPTPVEIPGGGIANAIVGSLMTVGFGLAIAAPLGVVAGFYAAGHPDTPLGLSLRFGVDVIAGIPSIVVGIFAYTLVVLPMRHFSAFSGGVVLAIIMLPIIIRSTEEILRLVPASLREASLALGAPEWRTSLSVVLPAAFDGVLTGLMLGVSRAAGEAAPMLFTAFGNPFMNIDPNQPVATLPHTIFIYAISPYADWRAKAWATALVLIGLVLLLNIAARGITWWRSRNLGKIRN